MNSTESKSIADQLESRIDRSRWQTWKFSDLAENINTKISPQKSDLEHYIGLEHLDSGSLKIRRFGDPKAIKGDKLKICKGDLIFAKRNAYLKRVAVAEFDAIASAHSMVLRAKPAVVLPEFLPFFMLSEAFWERAIAISVGSLSPTINWKALAKQEFCLPPKDQQAKLAELLWAADAVVARCQSALKLAIKTQKAAFHSSVDEAEKQQIKQVAVVSNGTTPSTKHPQYWKNGNIPWLSTGKVHDKFIRRSDTFITNEAIQEKKAKLKPANSSLVAMIGQGKTRGTSAMLMIDSAINQNFACVTPKSIDPTFLFYSLFFNYQRLRDISQGSNQLALNCELVGNLKIPCPEQSTQESTGDVSLLAEDAIDRLSAQISLSQRLHKSLINQIF